MNSEVKGSMCQPMCSNGKKGFLEFESEKKNERKSEYEIENSGEKKKTQNMQINFGKCVHSVNLRFKSRFITHGRIT